MTKIKSEGKCVYCNNTFSGAGIGRHLKQHLKDKVLHNKPGKSFLMKIEPDASYWSGSGYFLYLWVDGETPMQQIDAFLKSIWLECCGHMSAFRKPLIRNQRGGMWDFFEAQKLLENGKTKEYEAFMENANGEVPMSRKVKLAVQKDMKLLYEYDFGSSTNLQITIAEEYPFKSDEAIVLLSRNEPLEIYCGVCEKEIATKICTAHGWEDNSLFCKKCATQHAKSCEDFKDYASMPFVNSPRVGVCAYQGGEIDINRDGVFKKQNA